MGFRTRKTDDSYKCTVEDAQYMIHNCVLYNPKNQLYFKVKTIDYDDDSCLLECIDTGSEHLVMLSWLKNWMIL